MPFTGGRETAWIRQEVALMPMRRTTSSSNVRSRHPRKPAIEAVPSSEGGAGLQTSSPVRILLVEDDFDLREVTATLLRRLNYEVTAVGSVAKALEHAKKGCVDVLISDLRLPDGSGLDLMREVHEANANARGIALSGFDSAREALDAGFGVHLKKPIPFQTLSSTVQQLLAGHASPGMSGGAAD
jgi:CheY-like chemotaxis protein